MVSAGTEKTPMCRGEENGGKVVFQYDPKFSFVSHHISLQCVWVCGWGGGGGGIFVCIASVQVQALTSMSSLTT